MSEDEEILVTQEYASKLEKKAKAYDNYLKQVDEGKIVVLVADELNELAELMDTSMSLCNERVIAFLEEHSNWKWPGHE